MRRLIYRWGKWEYTWLCLLVIVVLAMHFSIINTPKYTVFDEAHYVNDARSVIAGNETIRGEHPPLGKLFVIAGMLIFGDNPFGWRFFSVILSAVSLILFYLICRNLSMSKRASFMATFLLAFENLTFTFYGMAMLDVSCLTFTLAAFLSYLRGNYPLSGIMVALSALAKLNGALALVAILIHWLIVRRDNILQFLKLVVYAPVSFALLMPFADLYLFHRFTNPLERISTMLTGSASLTYTALAKDHPYVQRPWEWIFRWDLTPYHFHPNYLGVVSYTILFLTIPVVIYMLYKAINPQISFRLFILSLPKKIWLFITNLPSRLKMPETSGSDAGIFGLAWFAATYLMWFPGVWITDRVTYPFYIYPTIGAICIGLGMGLSQLIRIFKVRKNGNGRWVAISIVTTFILAHLAFFVLMSPLSYWWGTPIFKGLGS